MSKAREAHRKSREAGGKLQEPVIVQPAVQFLRPQRGPAVVLGILLIALFLGMLAMYFKTVYPNRDRPHSIETDPAPLPAR